MDGPLFPQGKGLRAAEGPTAPAGGPPGSKASEGRRQDRGARMDGPLSPQGEGLRAAEGRTSSAGGPPGSEARRASAVPSSAGLLAAVPVQVAA